MIDDIKRAYADLRQTVAAFNQEWPQWVAGGTVWRLPVLAEQKTPDHISVERLDGSAAIEAAKAAYLEFERDLGQAPGTVMRLPGVFFMRRGVLDQVRQINTLKDALKQTIEDTRLELNQVPAARPRIMRRALGHAFNTNQLLRHIQAFEGEPRLVIFTWAGHTGGSEYKTVGEIREQLQAQADARVTRNGGPIDLTPESQDLKALVNMADASTLVKRKLIAPHPRAMFYFSKSTRYDAMIHANLPAFVLAGETQGELRGLKDFDRAARSAARPDQKARTEALPGTDLYLPPEQKQVLSTRQIDVPATYGLKITD